MFGVNSGVCFLLSGAKLDVIFTYGAQPLGFAPPQPFGVYPWQAYVQPGDGHLPTPHTHKVAAPSTTLNGESLLLLNLLFLANPSIWWSIQPWRLGRESPNPSTFPTWCGGVFFSMVNSESVMGIKPGDSSVVIGYLVDKFTHTLSAEQFVSHSHIYPGFTGKVSSLIHFPLELGCEDYSFLDQAMADFEQGLDSILINSLDTLELDTSLDEPDAITSSVSSGFLHSVTTLSDTSKLQLAPTIRSHKLWCQARALLAPVPLTTKMSAPKLICYFSSHLAAFGFQSSTPPDNTTLSSANRKANQSLLGFAD